MSPGGQHLVLKVWKNLTVLHLSMKTRKTNGLYGGWEVPRHDAKESIDTKTSILPQQPPISFPLPCLYLFIFLFYVHFACASVHRVHVVLLDGRRWHQIPWD